MPVPLVRLDLARGVVAAFTGRAPHGPGVVGDDDPSGMRDPANLAHHRPHVPSLLARARTSVADQLGIQVQDLHLMRQVHGSAVGTIGPAATPGAEIRHVDALVTDQPGRALVVQAADCVPVVAAHDAGPVGVAHAGRAGVERDVVGAMLSALLGAADGHPSDLHVALGPAIGGCCYEVPEQMVDSVARALETTYGSDVARVAAATTTWGTPSLDLPAAVEAVVRARGVTDVRSTPGCTRCGGEGRWFSHRRDARSGRHWGVVVRQLVGHEVAA